MLTNVDACARIVELQNAIAVGVITLEISDRNARVRELQDRWMQLRGAVDVITKERGREMADIPGGSAGFYARDYKGKDADTPVYKVDAGLVGLLAELRAHAKQAAEEFRQWTENRDIDVSALLTEINIVSVDPEDGRPKATSTPISLLGPAKNA